MKKMWKYLFIALGTACLYWVWFQLSPMLFTWHGAEESELLGTGMFLAFELVVLTGIILCHMQKK